MIEDPYLKVKEIVNEHQFYDRNDYFICKFNM